MRILGIHAALDAGAALIEDNTILAAINEERLNRYKLTTGFPVEAVEKVLEITNTKVEDIDFVAVQGKRGYFVQASKFNGWMENDNPDSLKNRIKSSICHFFGSNKLLWEGFQRMLIIATLKQRRALESFIRNNLGITAPIHFVDHHFSHACSAYFTSGFDRATVITMDGGGDGYSSRVYRVINNKFENLFDVNSYNSMGSYYAYATKFLGYKAHKHEGKITGLAAYGKPKYLDLMSEFITFEDGDIINKGRIFMWDAIRKLKERLPENHKREDIAASIQALLEKVAVKYCEHWIKKSGIRNVALVGGVFANVMLNQRIHELSCVDNVFVHPGMGDGGLAVGAAFTVNLKFNPNPELKSQKIEDVYFGPEYSNEEIERELKKEGLRYKYFEEIEKEIAKLLAKGHVVARFNGRMEYGPRALGNRSILYQATDPTVNDWLNKKLGRTEFMPFAPVTLKRFSEKCYNNFKGAEHAAKFMTMTFDCTDFMKKNCPAVVHVDGTARPQIIDEETNPSYNKILEEYHKITNLPTIINTSFNMHEEPIVCSPYDAIRAFKLGHLDYLAIANYLVKRK